VIVAESSLTSGEGEAPTQTYCAITEGQTSVRAHALRDRWIPLMWSAWLVAAGLAYLLGWSLVVHHSLWTTGNDLWGIFRAAHYVGWGFLGGIYTPSNGVNTLPGMSVLLAPVAMASGALGLTESSPTLFLYQPSAALLLQPIELLCACSVLFAADSVAVLLAIRASLRVWLIGVIAVVAWPVAALWGHAEDLLAVTFALVAIRLLLAGKSHRTGWLLGVGIVLQPLVVFLLPIGVGASAVGRRGRLVAQALGPGLVLVGIALAGNWSETYRALAEQPTPLSINHPTPWVSLAPQVGHVLVARATPSFQVERTGGHIAVLLVSGGPVRTIGLMFAVLAGVFVWKKRPEPVAILWLCALALAMRCYFDPVMTPYYLAPPLMVALIVAARMSRVRFGIAAIAGLTDTVFAYCRFSPWVWWLPVVGMLTVVLACGYPGRSCLFGGGPVMRASSETMFMTTLGGDGPPLAREGLSKRLELGITETTLAAPIHGNRRRH
jgi:hypothetical protein